MPVMPFIEKDQLFQDDMKTSVFLAEEKIARKLIAIDIEFKDF